MFFVFLSPEDGTACQHLLASLLLKIRYAEAVPEAERLHECYIGQTQISAAISLHPPRIAGDRLHHSPPLLSRRTRNEADEKRGKSCRVHEQLEAIDLGLADVRRRKRRLARS